MASSSTGMAPFERVAETLRQAVRTGRLQPGTKLPSNRELAKQEGVSLVTAQKAVGILQDEGWVVARPSVGVYVSDTQPAPQPPETLDELRQEVATLRATVTELQERVSDIERRQRPTKAG
ncbi:GntR family transcriptional regulator [Saccharomonospora halophila]|uniref:GntR family transcriptional regulator n=1 Tax=Saccharomonospora halophila TaxID=129922 RepID=UPI00048BECE9|nr:GntR family transcriptional regulator [Saccharomonospora halophila]